MFIKHENVHNQPGRHSQWKITPVLCWKMIAFQVSSSMMYISFFSDYTDSFSDNVGSKCT
jgi:hypothetical protein